MSGKNSNWLSDIKQCIHYKEPGLDCTLMKIPGKFPGKKIECGLAAVIQL